jgi:hypothetical protein
MAFDEIINNPMQSMQTAPPTTQAEVQGRRSEWSKALEDPNMKSALFRMGLQMMRGQNPGETGLAATARAGMDAMDFYATRTELDRKNKLEADAAAMQNRNTESQIETRGAQTGMAQAGESREQMKFDEWTEGKAQREQKNKLELEKAQRDGDTGKIDLLIKQQNLDEVKARADFLRQNPEMLKGTFKAEFEAPQLKNESQRASTAQSYASANSSNTSAKNAREQAQREAEIWESMTPEERKQKTLYPNGKSASAGSGAESGEYDGLAKSIIQEYNALPEKDKARYPTIDSYMQANYNITLGKSASAVFDAVRRLQAETVPTQKWGRDENGNPYLIK